MTDKRNVPHTEYMLVLAFFLFMAVGLLFEILLIMLFDFFEKKHFRISKKYTVGKRISIFLFPFWGLFSLFLFQFQHAASYALLFFECAIAGFFFESFGGYGIKKIFGINLWTYKYGNVGPYTSLLVLPYWGALGIILVSMGKLLGL